MATFILVLQAVIALPKIGALVEDALKAAIAWYVSKQQSDTLSQLADAAAMSARAKTDEDRYASAQAWQSALSRARITNN